MAESDDKKNLIDKMFEHKWEIKNWKDVVRNETFNRNATKHDLEADGIVYANVFVGILFDKANGVGMYWKHISKHHCLDNMEAHLVAEILRSDGNVVNTYKFQANATTGTKMYTSKSHWGPVVQNLHPTYTNSDGSLVIKLTFTLKGLPEIYSPTSKAFQTTCKNVFSQNLAALLNDQLNADIKLFTKDEIELPAHKLILHARCPVFASMFMSDFLENKTGLVNVDDISSKTMKLLLNYWYTGKLLPSWNNDDIIVEFVYASGKYQITEILKMLDEMLGLSIKTSDVDVDLLTMAHQLSLKNAEARILKRIIHKIDKAVNGAEILDMFYMSTEQLEKGGFTAFQVLKVCNDVMGKNDGADASFSDVELLAWVCKLDMKNVESKLLKRIVATVMKVSSAEELFTLFDRSNARNNRVCFSESSISNDLLVCVNPK